MKKNGIGSHHSTKSKTDCWLTPPHIIKSLGNFDLDPCSPDKRPWDTATNHISLPWDGLILPWKGRVWLNPPYSSKVGCWLERLKSHGEGTALVFARTETSWFFKHVWNGASALLFLKGRLHFYLPCGERSSLNCGAPSVLIAYGFNDAFSLENSGLKGSFVKNWLM